MRSPRLPSPRADRPIWSEGSIRGTEERGQRGNSDLSEEIPIVKCHLCADIADRAFESTPDRLQEVSVSFLKHVLESHPGELMSLLAERYGPIFLEKREMR